MNVSELHQELGVTPDAEGWFEPKKPQGELPIPREDYEKAIRGNLTRGHERLKNKPIDFRTFVYVGAGTTMAGFLEEIREKVAQPEKYLVTCSNKTGMYLLENGIVPHAHWIIDPKESKASDFEVTHEAVEYWLNLGAHPAVFDSLERQGRSVKVFLAASALEDVQLVQAEMGKQGFQSLLTIGGGSTAGVRAMTLADALGFRKLEYYGFDGAMDGDRFYSYHKERSEPLLDIETPDGRQFVSTPALSGQCQQFLLWHERMPWIEVEMFGDSLMQHVWIAQKERERYPSVRFTPEYAALQREFHSSREDYGRVGGKTSRLLESLAAQMPGATILDYGCGKQALQAACPTLRVDGYDPFLPGLDAEPEPHDIVVCGDVMEHVEPEYTLAVLDHIQSLCRKVVLFNIAIGPAVKTLPDGRNAHINQRSHAFWWGQLKKRWHISEGSESETSLVIVGQNLKAVEERIGHH